jgi:hypothetical protein
MVVQGSRGVSRRPLAPKVVDQPLGAYDLVGVQQEQRQECPAFRARDLDRPFAVEHLERAEESKLHLLPTLAPSGSAENPWTRG